MAQQESDLPKVFRGVDLGAHHSCCASSFVAEPFLTNVDVNDLANRSTPSIVALDSDSALREIGEAAESKISRNPKNTFTYLVPSALAAAHCLGEDSDLETARKRFGFAWSTEVNSDKLDTEILLGIYLKKLVVDLKHIQAADRQERVVFAVPDACFLGTAISEKEKLFSFFHNVLAVADAERTIDNVSLALHSECLATQWLHKYKERIIEAAEGLTVGSKSDVTLASVMLVDVGYNQTTAIMLDISLSSEEKEGESENTETVVQDRVHGSITARKTVPVGVFDFVNQLAAFGKDYALSKYKKEISLDSKQGYKLKTAMQKALRELSMLPDASVGMECFFDDESDFLMDLKREELEKAVLPVLEKVCECVKEVKKIGLEKLQAEGNETLVESGGDVEMAGTAVPEGPLAKFSVEIIGGGVRIPCVAAAIAEAGGVEVSALKRGLDGSSAVATGACLRAAGEKKEDKTEEGDIIIIQGSLRNQSFLRTSLLDGFHLLPKEKLASENNSLSTKLAIEAKLEAAELLAVVRLDAINAFESYIYEARAFVSPGAQSKAHFENPDKLDALVVEKEQWFFDHVDSTEAETATEEFEKQLKELKEEVCSNGQKWFEFAKEKEEKLNAELEAANALRVAEDKEDHDSRKLPNSERLRMAEKQRLEGNETFKAGSYNDAILRYQKAHAQIGKLFDLSPEDQTEKNRIALSCHLNAAQCYLKGVEKEDKGNKDKLEQLYKKVDRCCDSALEIDSGSVKAWYRKGLALKELGETDKAREAVGNGLKVEAGNAELGRLDKLLERQQVLEKKKQQKVFGKMFG